MRDTHEQEQNRANRHKKKQIQMLNQIISEWKQREKKVDAYRFIHLLANNKFAAAANNSSYSVDRRYIHSLIIHRLRDVINRK